MRAGSRKFAAGDGDAGALAGEFQPRGHAAEPAQVSAEEAEGSYRLLGAHRGLSEALINLSRQVGVIDWPRLREACF